MSSLIRKDIVDINGVPTHRMVRPQAEVSEEARQQAASTPVPSASSSSHPTASENIDKMLSDIAVTGVEMDIGGDEPQIAIIVQTVAYQQDFIPNDSVYALINADGSHTTYWGDEPLEDTAHLFDLQITEDGANGTTTQAQLDALTARVETVIAQGVAAIKAAGVSTEFSDDEDGEMSFSAAQKLKSINDDLIAAANI